MNSTPPHRSDLRRRVVALGIAAAAAVGGVAATASPAAAATDRPHDPIGAVRSVTAAPGGLVASGWAVDPDAPNDNATVVAIVDGRQRAALTPTTLANARVQQRYGTGSTPGFALTVPVPAGEHTVCIAISNTGAGLSTVLRCVATPLGRRLSSSEIAAHNPYGRIAHAWARSSSLHVKGWTSDPDWLTRSVLVVLYVDNHPVATVATHSYPTPRPAQAGRRSAFDITVPVSRGTHVGCLWVVDVGLGGNSFLGCRTRDTRGPAGTGTVTTPTLNKQVVAEAKRHLGQPYVWGAVGPKRFDCSGLVIYSYGKFGFTTPRISEDQFTQARLIPASRAVPGDLVFYHDSEGDVYHVGIYLSPGRTVAAIDESRGVDYQMIWDPTVTTYGSFTHT